MTLRLAMDTATPLGSVALDDDGDLVGEITIGHRRHAAELVPTIETLLRAARRRWQDLGVIVLGDGPGSFTGLRIGFATMQGLVREHPELTVHRAPSLLATGWAALSCGMGPVAAMYDALRGEVFAAIYQLEDGAVRTLFGPRLTTPKELAGSGLRPVVALGDGAAAHRAPMQRWTGRDPVGPPIGAPRASALLALHDVSGATSLIPEPASAEPEYGRTAEAQVRWEQRHGQPLPHPPRRAG